MGTDLCAVDRPAHSAESVAPPVSGIRRIWRDTGQVARRPVRDPVLDLYLDTFANRVARLGGFALGLYAEYRVAHLLGAEPAATGTDAVDLTWVTPVCNRPVRIQVKSAHRTDPATPFSFSLAAAASTGRRAGDLWVFARHTGSDHRSGWTYLVTKTARLCRFGDQKTVTASKLTELGDWVVDEAVAGVAVEVAATLRQW